MSNLTFELNSVDVTAYVNMGSVKLNFKRNDFATCSFSIQSNHLIPAGISNYFSFDVLLDGTTIFNGRVVNSSLEFESADHHTTKANCTEEVSPSLLYNQASYDFSDGTSNELQILTSIFATFSPNPITTHVIAGNLTAIVFTNSSYKRMLDDLANANSRYWYFDADQELHWFASTGEAAPFNFSDSPNNSTTFPYGKLTVKIDKDGIYNITGGTLICWEDGLRPGMAIGITNSHLSWTAESFIISEVQMTVLDNSAGKREYRITFGNAPLPRITDYIIRSNKIASTVDGGLVPAYENDTSKFLRSDGSYATVAGLATDTLWAAKGDLAVATGNDAATVLSKGTDGYFLKANSATATGLEWVAAGVGHSQNTDWILLNASSGLEVISYGILKTILQISSDCGFSGAGNMFFSNESAASGYVSIRAQDILYLTSDVSRIDMTAPLGVELPTLSSDPAGATEGTVYYNTSTKALRHYNGSAWGDIGGGHTQNTDWILLNGSGGSQLFASGRLKQTLYVDGTAYIMADAAGLNLSGYSSVTINSTNASSYILLSNSSKTGAYITLDSKARLTLGSASNDIYCTAPLGLILPALSGDPASGTEGAIYYHTTNHVIRHYNGSAWGDIGGGHTQNTDWILLNESGGITLIASGALKILMSVDANCGFSGTGNMHFSNESAASGYVSIRAQDILYLTSDTTYINCSAPAGFVLPVLTSDPAGSPEGGIYYHGTDHVIRHYNGSAWGDIGGGSHTQNTDWILLNTSGGTQLIASGALKSLMQIDANCGFTGTGNMYFSNESAASGFVSIRAQDILYLTSDTTYINCSAPAGFVLPVLTSDPAGSSEGGIYYHGTDHVIRHYNGSGWATIGGLGMVSHALDGSTYHSACSDITTFNASTSAHGLLKKLSNVATEFMNGQGNWAIPATTFDATQYDYTGSRAIDTVYQNTSGKMKVVNVSLSYSSGTDVICYAYCGSANPPTPVVAVSGGPMNAYSCFLLTFIVPKNYYYKITDSWGVTAVSHWFEWDIG